MSSTFVVTLRVIILALVSTGMACRATASDESDPVHAQGLNNQTSQTNAGPLPECEWCGAVEAPRQLSWEAVIVDGDEKGEKLVITGTVFQPDGRTPVPDVLLYVYHTNNSGVYPKRGNETGNGRRHGYLRTWLRTNERGEYRFTTIKPAAYPGRTEPAHIHMTVKEANKAEYYIDDILFEDDPLITPQYRARLRGRGGAGIIRLLKDDAGFWKGRRDIVLEKRPS